MQDNPLYAKMENLKKKDFITQLEDYNTNEVKHKHVGDADNDQDSTNLASEGESRLPS